VRLVVRHHFVPDTPIDGRHMFKFVVLTAALVREVGEIEMSF